VAKCPLTAHTCFYNPRSPLRDLPLTRFSTRSLTCSATDLGELSLIFHLIFRLSFHLRRSDHITDALVSLHWLRVPERIQFKIAATHRGIWGRSQWLK